MSLSFDLAVPDPDFPNFTVRSEDQLLGRPTEGQIEIAAFFGHLKLFVADAQQKGPVNGSTIFDELRQNNAPVLGPNVGEFLYRNQHLIPVELRGMVALVFWGKIYRNRPSVFRRYVRCLLWFGERWVWRCYWIDSDSWDVYDRAVVLAS